MHELALSLLAGCGLFQVGMGLCFINAGVVEADPVN
jgi:hypothetical protein